MKRLFAFFIAILLTGCSDPGFDLWRADRLAVGSQRSYAQALRLYQRALRTARSEGQRDEVLFKLGKLYLQAGDYPSAAGEFRQIKSREGLALLAEALYKNADFTGALEVFNKYGDKGSDEYLFYYGLTLEKNNLYDQALRIYASIQADPFLKQKARERTNAINLASGRAAFSGIADEVRELIQKSPGLQEYPEASALNLLLDDNIYLTEDNRLLSDSHAVVKILNDRGKEKFAEVVLTYDSTYEKLDVEYARTIKSDGTVVTVGDKNIRDVSLYLNYPLYSNARARIISMPEVASGVCIEYKIKISRSQLPNKKDFATSYWLQADEPILLQRCAISVPKNKKLRHKIVNAAYNTLGFDMEPKVAGTRDRTVYALEFRDVPQIIPEPSMPPLSRINPYILFSTFESWQDIYQWWRSLYQDKAVADEEIKARAAELTKGKKTLEEKIRALYNFCVQEVRYVAVEYGDAGYEPHRASEVFQNKYGDCKDKAILLIAMLGAVGIDAYPVLISTYDSFDVQEDLPSLSFNHAIAAVQLDDEITFMDVTGATVTFGDLPPDDQDRLTLVFFEDKYSLIKTPLFGALHNRISTHMKIQVNKDESIRAERSVTTSGTYSQAQRYWLKFTMPVLIEESLKQKARVIADNAELQHYEIKNVDDLDKPVLLGYTFIAPRYLVKAGSSRIMDQLGAIDISALTKESRRYPIENAALDFQEELIEIELPAHLTVKYLPAPVEMRTKWFDLSSKYEIIDKDTIRFTYADRARERTVSIDEYPEYKKTLESIAALTNQHVVLEVK